MIKDIFFNYLNILQKCISIVEENEIFFEFVKKHSEYNHFYNFTLREFDHKSFLEHLIENGRVNPAGFTEIDGKQHNNTHLYLNSLISMQNAYYHVVFCLPLFLRKIKVSDFFNDELRQILVNPSIEINERYIATQSMLIDAIGMLYPSELKNLLKSYKFDMVTSNS